MLRLGLLIILLSVSDIKAGTLSDIDTFVKWLRAAEPALYEELENAAINNPKLNGQKIAIYFNPANQTNYTPTFLALFDYAVKDRFQKDIGLILVEANNTMKGELTRAQSRFIGENNNQYSIPYKEYIRRLLFNLPSDTKNFAINHLRIIDHNRKFIKDVVLKVMLGYSMTPNREHGSEQIGIFLDSDGFMLTTDERPLRTRSDEIQRRAKRRITFYRSTENPKHWRFAYDRHLDGRVRMIVRRSFSSVIESDPINDSFIFDGLCNGFGSATHDSQFGK